MGLDSHPSQNVAQLKQPFRRFYLAGLDQFLFLAEIERRRVSLPPVA
jgi:hypothetical protein